MNITKLLLTTLMLFSFSHAKNSFKKYSDMCETSDSQQCINSVDEVRNLQIALNSDKNLNLNLKTDGKWGKKTKIAVQKFQEQNKLSPSAGYVGRKTKHKLDKLFKDLKLPNVKIKKSSSSKHYSSFKKNTNLKKSFKVFKDVSLLKKANVKNSHLKVDIKEQRIRLYIDGKVALCSPCTTGSKRKFEPNTKIIRDKRTPKGTFKITEKLSDKRSNIFGKYYRNGKLVYNGDRRKYRGSKKGLKFVGASLRDWMRITSSGIGFHASKYVKRHPASNGCIRLPKNVANTLFSKVKKGTKVSIVN